MDADATGMIVLGVAAACALWALLILAPMPAASASAEPPPPPIRISDLECGALAELAADPDRWLAYCDKKAADQAERMAERSAVLQPLIHILYGALLCLAAMIAYIIARIVRDELRGDY